MSVLSPDERAAVHERTLQVLGEIGMRVDTEPGRRILAAAGAHVEEATRRVRFPAAFVEECLRAAPKSFVLGGRRPDLRIALNGSSLSVLADGGATIVWDGAAGTHRAPTYQDWLDSTRLQDAADGLQLYWGMVEPGQGDWRHRDWMVYFRDLFALYGKHVQDSFADPQLAPMLVELLDIVFGGSDEVRRIKPFSFLITPASPLIIERTFVETWLAMRGRDIPVAVMPMALMGATAPASLLGTIVQVNAEVLGTICLIQAAAPGTPTIHAGIAAPMDPRSGRYYAGAIEGSLMAAGLVEMARFYGLPVEGSGCGTEHVVPGVQAAYEKASTTLLTALARPDIMVGPGLLAGATIYAPEQLVLDLEAFAVAQRSLEGVRVDDESWLTDVSRRVGAGGSFLSDRSTRRATRSGVWHLSDLGMHQTLDSWLAAGRPDIVDEARERAAQMLAAHRPLPLSPDVARELDDLVARAAL
jgi:trimethylamine--corrinoid protein Co-methyltransferase